MDETRQFVYFLRPKRLEMLTKGPTPEEVRAQSEHASYLEGLANRGIVMLAGRTSNNDETTVGIVIVNASDEAAAQEIMNGDPFVVTGLMTATLFPFRVAYKTI
ncbi:MAG TPA: YciI family protein [Candidatus Binataceae bacterium]|nr:YciI family protein [Candidatus Binataceae bacterium]